LRDQVRGRDDGRARQKRGGEQKSHFATTSPHPCLLTNLASGQTLR
jgi:hypothetical protein